MKKNIIIVLVLSLWFTSAYWLGSYYRRAQLAGVAIQKYVDVLDAESTDPQCTLEHCPNSSKSLPGMPEDRALFTSNEQFNVEMKDSPTGPPTATEFAVKHVTKKDNGMVEAIVYGTTTKCYFPGDNGIISDLFRITLAPSTIKGEYVVIEDKRLGEKENPVPYARTLYRSKKKGYPPCPLRSKAS